MTAICDNPEATDDMHDMIQAEAIDFSEMNNKHWLPEHNEAEIM